MASSKSPTGIPSGTAESKAMARSRPPLPRPLHGQTPEALRPTLQIPGATRAPVRDPQQDALPSSTRFVKFLTEERRFQYKIYKRGDCWEWRAAEGAGGYGVFRRYGGNRYAHCVAYEMAKGPIPFGYEIDHLCRHRWCVRPSHLEAVTSIENTRRGDNWQRKKTHCPRGHVYDLSYPRKAGRYAGHLKRACSICTNLRTIKSNQTKKNRRSSRGA